MSALGRRAVHLGWMFRKRRAQIANVLGRPFTYQHQSLGRFVYHPWDDLSRHVLLYAFEEPELRFAAQRARDGGIVLDVGANIGVFSVVCARAAGARGRVIALEPSPSTFKKLRLTCELLALTNVELHAVAAGATHGRARFVGSGIHELRQHLADARGDAGLALDVDVRRLDDVCGDRADAVTLLKIDVEGHEYAALQGAARILANGRAHLIVEFFPAALQAAGGSAEALQELLSRTHRCTSAVYPDGTVVANPPHVTVQPPHETVNTFWIPRDLR